MQIHPVEFKSLGGVYEKDDLDAVNSILHKVINAEESFFPLPEENDFQNALARHEGADFAMAVNSCGTALDLCMMVLGIGPGNEVITTGLSFVCTGTCIAARGAKVVFADIDPVTMNLDPAKVRAKITKRTRAIIPVHFTGLCSDIDEFEKISQETGIPIIFDAAHAVGALYNGRPIGGRGLASCYSFQSNKNMTTLGEGGAVTTNDADFAEKIRQKKTFGYVYGHKLKVVTVGFNYRLSKIQCAVGITQLAKAKRIISERQKRMSKMTEYLTGVDELILPAGHNSKHGSHLYVVRLDTDKVRFDTDTLREHLKKKYQIGTAKQYDAIWSWDAFREIDFDNSGCPVTEKACGQVFSLPVFPDTSLEDLQYVAWALKESISDLKKEQL